MIINFPDLISRLIIKRFPELTLLCSREKIFKRPNREKPVYGNI